MIKFFLFVILGLLNASAGYCQDAKQLIGQVAEIYTGNGLSNNGLIAGFTFWGLMGGIIFSSVGFVAFVYGKKNSEYKPMVLGIALMVYPMLLKGTAMLYVVGIGLTAALFFFRD